MLTQDIAIHLAFILFILCSAFFLRFLRNQKLTTISTSDRKRTIPWII